MRSDAPTPRAAVYLGVFLISAAGLLFQVTFTRIFSVAIWYHFAFLVVSVALFGFGASGVALALFAPRTRGADLPSTCAFLFAVSALFAYLGTNLVPFSPFRIPSEPIQIVFFALIDVLLAVPFFFAGATVALVLRAWPVHSGRLYAVDLLGAGLGTLAVFLALPILGAAGTIVLAALLGVGASFALVGTPRARMLPVVGAVVTLPLLALAQRLPDVRIDATKPLRTEVDERQGRVTFTKWNSLSRIDVVERAGIDPMILIDAAAVTYLSQPATPQSTSARDVSALVYHIKEGPSAVIIGSGGGTDVQNAVALGAERVTCVEINPIIIGLVTGPYEAHIGHVFEDPRVRLVRDEGRSFIERAKEKFDVVQLTLIDTWAAGASGAYSLTENYLYTTEAFEAYLDALSDEGVLSITRWYFEAPRLATLARTALEHRRVAYPGRHVLAVQRKIATTFLVKRTPFRPEEVEAARAFAAETGADVLFDPSRSSNPGFFGDYFASPDPRALLASTPMNVGAVSDDDPFFFQMARWGGLGLGQLRTVTNRNFLEPLVVPVGQIVLVSALVIGLVLSALLLGGTLARGGVPRQGRGLWGAYFFALGFAYIVVEVVLMQRFALFLGHPTYSVTLVLAAILVFSGLGSFWSAPRQGGLARSLRPALLGLPVALVLLAFVVPSLTRAAMGWPLAARMFAAILFIAPAAFFMGVPFPTGLRAANEASPAFVAWAWAVNGCASVIGSVCAVLGAMMWGFTAMLLVAGLVYVAALVAASRANAGAGAPVAAGALSP